MVTFAGALASAAWSFCCFGSQNRLSHNFFFLPLSLKGTTGFEAQIDKCLELAEYLYNKIKNREGYEMVFDGKVCIATSFSQLVNSSCLNHLLICYQQVKPNSMLTGGLPVKEKKKIK